MRLTDLHPEPIKYNGRRGVGVKFKCPACQVVTLAVLFLNPLDGGPSIGDDENCLGNNKGKRWARSGMTFEDMSLHPSVDASKVEPLAQYSAEENSRRVHPCTHGGHSHWHGFVIDGEIR
jgi:hypothetical protein